MEDPVLVPAPLEPTAGDRERSKYVGSDVAVELLGRARELVERGWCQGQAALDDDGGVAEPWSPRARRWSADGALALAHHELGRAGRSPESVRSGFERAELALAAVVGEDLSAWNDAAGRTQGDVLAVFEAALARAERLELPRHTPRVPAGGRGRAPVPLGAFDERRRELEGFLAESDRSGASNGDLLDDQNRLHELVGRLELDVATQPARKSAQLLAQIVRKATDERLHTVATLAGRLSEKEREALAGILRLPQNERCALAALLDLPANERAELGATLVLSDEECRALAAFVHSGEHEPGPSRTSRSAASSQAS